MNKIELFYLFECVWLSKESERVGVQNLQNLQNFAIFLQKY